MSCSRLLFPPAKLFIRGIVKKSASTSGSQLGRSGCKLGGVRPTAREIDKLVVVMAFWRPPTDRGLPAPSLSLLASVPICCSSSEPVSGLQSPHGEPLRLWYVTTMSALPPLRRSDRNLPIARFLNHQWQFLFLEYTDIIPGNSFFLVSLISAIIEEHGGPPKSSANKTDLLPGLSGRLHG